MLKKLKEVVNTLNISVLSLALNDKYILFYFLLDLFSVRRCLNALAQILLTYRTVTWRIFGAETWECSSFTRNHKALFLFME